MRQCNLTLAELIDKLTIEQIKEVLLNSGSEDISNTEHDIDIVIKQKKLPASFSIVQTIIQLSQANLHVWYIKDKLLDNPNNYMELLIQAQELNNGVRNHLKNQLMKLAGELTPATRKTTFK